ncbi:uncharacterized protein AMSG_08488 [Thecamonas trahens ATCC 50062]|uniref:F-box domain-containing protein n=1 Tax=Thecamonas trahens ATCC 50062 TaxID=461836 RepID=A0A0L0DK16_THETB|nr:hypothetical protein AMSG_08488 [Thecamonas trahens ATCC 50062]KNC52622.1 hypothetical protein AMSG_08488 [Thecamonas trahens ATCC 50062]|eukprot:XP_013755179.1 hypothetical protein AMSG_08488 [Thecamonas trahens ATCC 50062]
MRVKVKWKKSQLEIEVDRSAPVTAFLQQLQTVTGVLLAHQKVLVPGGRLRADAVWSDYPRMKNGCAVMLFGSPSVDPRLQSHIFTMLPDELLLAIFRFLDVTSLARARQVCIRFCAVASDASLWRPVCDAGEFRLEHVLDASIRGDTSLHRFHRMFCHNLNRARTWAEADVDCTLLAYGDTAPRTLHTLQFSPLFLCASERRAIASPESLAAPGKIHVWSMADGSPVSTLTATSSALIHFRFARSTLVAGAADGARVWDLDTMACRGYLAAGDSIAAVDVLPSANACILAPTAAPGLALYDLETEAQLRCLAPGPLARECLRPSWAFVDFTARTSRSAVPLWSMVSLRPLAHAAPSEAPGSSTADALPLLDLDTISGPLAHDPLPAATGEDDSGFAQPVPAPIISHILHDAAAAANPFMHCSAASDHLVAGFTPSQAYVFDIRAPLPVRSFAANSAGRNSKITPNLHGALSASGRFTLTDLGTSKPILSIRPDTDITTHAQTHAMDFTAVRAVFALATMRYPVVSVVDLQTGDPMAFLDDPVLIDRVSGGARGNGVYFPGSMSSLLQASHELVVCGQRTDGVSIWAAGLAPF